MLKVSLALFMSCVLGLGILKAQDNTDWRGPQRDGIYPEKGLAKQWPAKGPELLWTFENIGHGHSSVGIGNNRVFINGMIDSTGVLYALDMTGKLLWKKNYGKEWYVNYTGSRSTPLVIDDLLYLESGMGVVFCFNVNDGSLIWSVDLLKQFKANNIRWGMSESLLIDGDNIICTPGGEKHNLVALNRFTGETIWTSKGFKEPAAYCSPLMINHNGTKLILTMTATSAMGFDAKTGEMYWRAEQNQGNKIHANTPLYKDGIVYFSSSSAKQNGGLLALKLSTDGKKAETLWRNEEFKNLMGGIVLLDGMIYGSKYRSSEWYAIDAGTGNATLLNDEFQNGVIIYADGLFYCYNEKGEMALVDMAKNRFDFRGKFDVPLGENQHWAHPVIHNKRLYLRHGSALMVYNIAE